MLGVGRGHMVAIHGDNSIAFVAALFASFRLGAVACLLNTREPAEVIRKQVNDLGAKVLLSDRFDGELGNSVIPVVSISVFGNGRIDGPLSSELVEQDESVGAEWQLSNRATVVFTSGSTGKPKAVVHSLANHYYSAEGSSHAIPLRTEHVWLASLPMYHVGGIAILFRCFLAGCAVDIVQPREAPEKVSAPRVTHVSLVQAQLKRWLDLGARVGPSIEVALVGGSAISPALVRVSVDKGLPLRLTYGSTEMSSQISTMMTPASPDSWAAGTCGTILPFREVRVGADDRIRVRGLTRFVGYLVAGVIVEPFEEGGWFATSDIGHIEQGELFVTGRFDNMFISGGENIHPEPIERAVSAIDGVREVVVVPVVDEEFGRRPVAVIDSSSPIRVSDLKAMLSSVLPRYMIPTAVAPWPLDQDRDIVSKIDRIRLQEYAEMYLQGQNR